MSPRVLTPDARALIASRISRSSSWSVVSSGCAAGSFDVPDATALWRRLIHFTSRKTEKATIRNEMIVLANAPHATTTAPAALAAASVS